MFHLAGIAQRHSWSKWMGFFWKHSTTCSRKNRRFWTHPRSATFQTAEKSVLITSGDRALRPKGVTDLEIVGAWQSPQPGKQYQPLEDDMKSWGSGWREKEPGWHSGLPFPTNLPLAGKGDPTMCSSVKSEIPSWHMSGGLG